jgi:hypothetical protein
MAGRLTIARAKAAVAAVELCHACSFIVVEVKEA